MITKMKCARPSNRLARLVWLSTVAAPFYANAQSAEWPQEPRTVFGIALGEPIASLPLCPPEKKLGDNLKLEAPCWVARLPVTVYGLPKLAFHYRVDITPYNRKIQSINISARQNDFTSLLEVLVERYGPPTSRSQSVVQNALGAQFDSYTFRWSGGKTEIFAFERFGKIDESRVIFTDKATALEEMNNKIDSTKQSASKL